MLAADRQLALVAAALGRVTVRLRAPGGGGAGVVWRPGGLIVTSAHVVAASRVVVDVPDGRALEGRLAGRDERRDLAVVLVDGPDLPAAVIGDSETLRVGDLVIAVGHPLGLRGALSAGIVHAVGGTGTGAAGRFIRADIRLAPGNSGGLLADAAGRVVGVNAMTVGGLGLAVPSREVERFLHDVRSGS